MARIRTVKPGFFTSLTVCELPRDVRLTFIGLWTHCDDEGRCVAEARLVKAALWPLDDDIDTRTIEKHLAYLEDAGLVSLYHVSRRRYLQVSGWKEHQSISKPRPSDLPSIDEAEAPPEPSSTSPGTLPEPSPQEGKGKEQGKERDRSAGDEGFDDFWAVYPKRNGRKEGKGAALVEWRKLTLEQRRRAYIGARNLAQGDEYPKDAERFLRRDKAGEFIFDRWQKAPVRQLRSMPPEPSEADRHNPEAWTRRGA